MKTLISTLSLALLTLPSLGWADACGASGPTGQGGSDDVVKINTQLVTVDTRVEIKYGPRSGEFVPGLKAEDFEIFEKVPEKDGSKKLVWKKAEVSHFSDVDMPISLSIVFDASGSMDKDRIARAADGLREIVARSMTAGDRDVKAGDQFMLTVVNNKIHQTPWTRDPDVLLGSAMSFTKTEVEKGQKGANGKKDQPKIVQVGSGLTALRDGIHEAAKKLQKLQPDALRRKILLVISDGEDNQSRYNDGEVREVLKESDISVYSMIISDPNARAEEQKYIDAQRMTEIPLPLQLMIQAQSMMQELAGEKLGLNDLGGRNGHWIIPSTNTQIQDWLDWMSNQIRRGYAISFYPSSPEDTKFHPIQVRFARSKEEVAKGSSDKPKRYYKVEELKGDGKKTEHVEREAMVRAREGFKYLICDGKQK